MSGHSKFANIKHKKEKNDAAKGKIFTVIGRETCRSSKRGRPGSGKQQQVCVMLSQRQRQTICRMIPSTVVSRRQQVMLTPSTTRYCTYEGYGPSGVAIIVDTLTDNKNRTAANVRKCIYQGQRKHRYPGQRILHVRQEGPDHHRQGRV